jgi:hypothetical protein
VDCLIDFCGHGTIKWELGTLLGSERERTVNRGRGKMKGFGVDRLVHTHGFKDAWVRSSLVFDVFSVSAVTFVSASGKTSFHKLALIRTHRSRDYTNY